VKILKIVYRIFGFGFFVGGLFYFLDAVNSIADTTNMVVIIIRFINGSVWLLAGYGFMRLHEWSLYALGGMIAMFISTAFFNQFISGVAPERLGSLGFMIILFFIAFSQRNKLYEKVTKKIK